jgi:hypothetical protein
MAKNSNKNRPSPDEDKSIDGSLYGVIATIFLVLVLIMIRTKYDIMSFYDLFAIISINFTAIAFYSRKQHPGQLSFLLIGIITLLIAASLVWFYWLGLSPR